MLQQYQQQQGHEVPSYKHVANELSRLIQNAQRLQRVADDRLAILVELSNIVLDIAESDLRFSLSDLDLRPRFLQLADTLGQPQPLGPPQVAPPVAHPGQHAPYYGPNGHTPPPNGGQPGYAMRDVLQRAAHDEAQQRPPGPPRRS
jgi:hypothetical protein